MLQPLGKRILIEPIAPTEKKSIIIVKDESPQTFKVVAVGDEVTKVNTSDTIFIASMSTSEFTFEGIKHILIHQDNIIAKVV